MNYRISRDDLTKRIIDEGRGTTYCFEGGDHGLAHLSFIVGEYQPGCIARKHRHAYDEIFIVNEGCGTYTIGDRTVHAKPGDVVIVPAGAWHRFQNDAEQVLRHTAIHGAGALAMEFSSD